jgi:Cdc6-like AAA superfamily ATPase
MNVIKSRISNTTTINSVKRYLSQSKINDNTIKETTNLFNKVQTIFTMKVVGGLTAAFIVSLPIAAYGFDYYDQRNINETLIQGQNVEASTDYYERTDISELLSSKISPSNKKEKNYYIISGVKGVGKTTSIKHFTKSRYNNKDVNKKGGVIYVSCDDANKFGKAFADAISYSTIYRPSLFRAFYSIFNILPTVDVRSSKDTFDACEEKFYNAIDNYKKKTGKTPILIIDNVNNFLMNETGKSFLQILQKRAKEDAVRFIIYT